MSVCGLLKQEHVIAVYFFGRYIHTCTSHRQITAKSTWASESMKQQPSIQQSVSYRNFDHLTSHVIAGPQNDLFRLTSNENTMKEV